MSRDPGTVEARTRLSSLSLRRRLGWCQMATLRPTGQVAPSVPRLLNTGPKAKDGRELGLLGMLRVKGHCY